MKVKKDIKKTLAFDPEKCNDLYTGLVEVFQKHKPSVGEIIIATGNLIYALGASIGGYPEKGPSLEELKRLYYIDPGKISLALMMSGTQMCSWYSSYEAQQLGKKTQDNKEEFTNGSNAVSDL